MSFANKDPVVNPQKEPNNIGGNENCVAFCPNGNWCDYVCDAKYKIICEK
ncbi:hypothetical protein B4U80_14945 [Leptotrombidium deliense]|uniref:C-type lectin domain-containing protein n=1 Tax=Leptotrombidium deliense TaxID=299467 RepID=A0A443RXX3_9ACAR|nr:hypothetical protein B4U80_14945 [Leptotrombidium deliense]